ncbi:MAG: amino acid adenylation domain-containing protein [Desulfobacterales bacterium]|nr:amino acid adenylation domain-containing protein [Desulfobacterales bacterium]
MKKTVELIAELELRDIKLSVENGNLRYNAPKGAITPFLRAQIVDNKQALISLIEQRAATVSDKNEWQTEEASIPLQSRERGLPLSSAQQRFWFLDQLDQGNSTAFNMPPIVIRLNGVLNIEALQRAFDDIVRRHEVLRSTFRMQDGIPVQIPLDTIQIPIRLHDIRELDEDAQQKELNKITIQEASTPFDLKHSRVLLRVVLLQTKNQEHYIILTIHHIIADGWSIGILIREVGLLYRAYVKKTSALLPPLPIHYADYASWERSRLQTQRMERQKAYWLEQLKGTPTLLELPTDFPRPRIRRNYGRSEHFILEPDIAMQLQEFSKKTAMTPYMVLLASYAALLCRYTSQEEMVIGSPISVRPHSQTEPLIGLFLNTLALRIDLSANPSFFELAQRIRKLTIEAFENSEFPFEVLLQELNLERSLNFTPLFQVLFAFQNAPISPIELEGLTITPMPPGEELISPFDLVLSIDDIEHTAIGHDTNAGLSAKFRYNTDLFEAPSIIRMIGHYKNLLKNMLLNPDQSIRTLPILSQQELDQFKIWQGGHQSFPVTETLTQVFEKQVDQTPDAIALTLNGRHLSYRELNERTNDLAQRLITFNHDGVKDQRVGLCIERSIELVVGIIAILKAGAAYVPLDPSYPDERLHFIVKDADIRVIVGSPELVASLELKSVTVINPLDTPDGKFSENPLPQSSIDSIAYVIYTSGSTGLPKGVLVTHANVVRLFTGTEQLFGFNNTDVWTMFHSFAFDFSVWELWGALLYGGRLVIVSHAVSRSPQAFYELLSAEGVTVLNQTPSAFRQLIEVDRNISDSSLAIKWVIFGGEALEPRTLKPWVQKYGLDKPQLINMYGITETTVHVTYHRLTADEIEEGGSPIGDSLLDLSLHLVDQYNQLVPIGVAGEILVGGAGVSNGYLNRPELTSVRFVTADSVGIDAKIGKLYRSGDLARWRPEANGQLEYLGRIDMQVKIRGFRIELGEIEGVLVSHPKVREAVVEPRKSAGDKQSATISLVAYVTLETKEQSGMIIELRQYLNQKLPDYMVPAFIVIMDTLPLTTNGKIDRRALPDPDTQRPDLNTQLVPPTTPLECMLAELWRQVLGITTIGLDDNFFELGGDSIKGVIFTNKLQEKLKRVVYVVALFEAPTIRELVNYLHQHYQDGLGEEFSHPDVIASTQSTRLERIDEENVGRFVRAIKPIEPVPGLKEDTRRNPQAIFILAPPRSGTTLIRVLLGGHPKLFAPPELELLLFNSLDERKIICSGRDSFWLEGTLRAVMEILKIDGDTAKQLMAEREDRGILVKDFYGEMQSWLGDKILVDKSPSYALDLAVLQRAEEYFSNTLYIHLHRHPYGMIHSFEEAKLDQIFFRHPHNFATRQLAELIWLQSHRNIIRFLASVPPERQTQISFEEMTLQPEQSMKKLCSFIGIGFAPEMLALYEAKEQRKRMTDGIHAESKMLGDIKFHTHNQIDASVSERWRSHYKEDFLGEPAWDMALALGYSRTIQHSEAIRSDSQKEIAIHLEQVENGLPLSFAQQRLWFLDQLEGAGTAYNMPVAIRIEGEFKTEVFTLIFKTIAERHEVLRSKFDTVDGVPVVRISPQAPEMQIIDLSQLNYAEQNDKIKEVLESDTCGSFNLNTGPLFRSSLLKLNNQTAIILVNMHHIVSDGWSMGILVREWSELYHLAVSNQHPELPPIPFHYVDYARRQRCWAAQGGLQRDLDYWKKQLTGAPALLELPTDRPRPPIQRFNGNTMTFTIPADLTQSLKRIAESANASLYMVLLSAFGVLLMRYSGQKDVLIGSPSANRTTKEVEGLIGFFVNTLVMRLAVNPDMSFTDLISQVRLTALDAYTHQEVPFEKLVEELRPERNLSYSPLFQVMLSMQTAPASAPELNGLNVSVIDQPTHISKYDLTLSITETIGQNAQKTPILFSSFEYNTDLFNQDTIERMIGHLMNLLKGIVSNVNSTLVQLPLLTDSEYHNLVYEFNNTIQPFAESKTIHALFEEQVERTPNAIALQLGRDANTLLTYAQVNCRANQLAHCLREIGVSTETMVAIAIERSFEMIIGLLAILKAGGTYVPLDQTYPKERIAYILADAGVKVLLTQSTLVANLPDYQGQTICIDMEHQKLNNYPETNIHSLANLVAKAENLAYIIYTSGSTGNPKGVMIPHGAVVNFLNSMAKSPGIHSNDRLLAVTTICFDIAVLEMYLPLTVGARVVIASEAMTRDADMLSKTLSEQAITVMQATPATWRLLLSNGWQGTQHLKILCGGEALPSSLASELLNKSESVWNVYGPTETTVWSTLHQVTNATGEKAQPIGRPLDNTSLYILDEAMNPVPLGVAGELFIGGTGLARGYFNRPELTAEKFVTDPFTSSSKQSFTQFISDELPKMYRTGDLARYRSDGVVEYLGRVDHQIKFRGFRIELGEIEHALTCIEGIEVGAVIAEKDTDQSIKRLVAFYVPKSKNNGDASGTKLMHSELRSALQKSLPDYMLPSLFVEIDKMPLTPNGKIDRRALTVPNTMDRSFGQEGARPNFIGGRDTMEVQLSRIWEEVLDINPIGIRDNFFELGGHSLVAVRLMAQVKRCFNKHLPLSALFQGATVEAMAKLLREDKNQHFFASLVPIQTKGSRTPFFCIPGAGGNVVYLHHLARELNALSKEADLIPFYGLQPPGLDGMTTPYNNVENLAAHYIQVIREVQPHGPYFIGGHSFGGLVAFEMTRQLQKTGEIVANLVLLDTPAPRFFEPTGRDWDEARWLTQVANIAGHQYGTNLNINYELLQPLPTEKQLELVHERLRMHDILPPDAELVHFRGFIEVYKANLKALYHFTEPAKPTQFILLRSKDEQPEGIASPLMRVVRALPDLGWGECVFQPIKVIESPGDHLTMLRPPYVSNLAAELKNHLYEL